MPPISRVFLFLFPLLCVLLGTACPAKGAHCSEIAPTLADLERRFACDISLAALDVQGGQKVLYRADNRFAFCSTFKFFLVAEVLRKADADRSLVGKRLFWKENEEQEWSPATRGRGGEGMSVIALCEAAMTLSDNTAANLLLRLLGGPFAMTKGMRALGDRNFLLCDYEPRLNYTGTELANRGENRLPQANTATAAGFLQAMRTLLFDRAYPDFSRNLLLQLAGKTRTGTGRIQASLPKGATLFHKTGTGFGNVHDLALVRYPNGRECLLVIFTKNTQNVEKEDQAGRVARQERAMSEAVRTVLEYLGM